MSRYIDADALECDTEWSEYHDGFISYSQLEIDTAPSIDIVRCGECEYWRAYETWSECGLWAADPYETAKTNADDFCSYGSRSEKPNNCEYAENPSGDVWECGCFLDTYCEHQIYDRNPDGTINIVECRCEPKDEPQTERSE